LGGTKIFGGNCPRGYELAVNTAHRCNNSQIRLGTWSFTQKVLDNFQLHQIFQSAYTTFHSLFCNASNRYQSSINQKNSQNWFS